MNLDEAWDIIDAANCQADENMRKAEIESAIGILNDLIKNGEIRAFYPLGFAYYSHPNRRAAGSFECLGTVKAFQAAIREHVEPTLSNIYLAYHYFDMREYGLARRHADAVIESELDEEMAIRYWELKLCIDIERKGLAESIPEIRNYASNIGKLPAPALPPMDLMNTLESRTSGASPSEAIVGVLKELEQAYPILGKDSFTRFLRGRRS